MADDATAPNEAEPWKTLTAQMQLLRNEPQARQGRRAIVLELSSKSDVI